MVCLLCSSYMKSPILHCAGHRIVAAVCFVIAPKFWFECCGYHAPNNMLLLLFAEKVFRFGHCELVSARRQRGCHAICIDCHQYECHETIILMLLMYGEGANDVFCLSSTDCIVDYS